MESERKKNSAEYDIFNSCKAVFNILINIHRLSEAENQLRASQREVRSFEREVLFTNFFTMCRKSN